MNWRDIGDTTFEAWTAIIRARAPQSPILKAGRKAYDAARPHSRLCLGQTWAEDQFQTDPSTKFPITNYNPMNMKTPTGSGWMQFGDYPAGIQGWNDRITSLTYKNGIYAATTTLPEFVHVYAPSSDNNDEAAYVRTIELIVAELNEFERDTGGVIPVPTVQLPYVLLVAGHRSTGDPGNPTEKSLTDDLAVAYTDAFRAAGFKADWWQRDVDKDSDPTQTIGTLDTVSVGCSRYLAGIKGPKMLLDLHFNGPTSAVHAICPDVDGLVTAYPGGAPANDTYANNILDRYFLALWAQDVARVFGLQIYDGAALEPGIMLERETGVGLDGYRLATMAASAAAGLQDDTIRGVLEHAGYDQWGSGVDRTAKFKKVAQIAVAAAQRVYSAVPTVPPTPSEYANPITNWMKGKNTTLTQQVFVKDGDETKPIDVVYDIYAVRRPVQVIATTNRRQGPSGKSPRVGPALKVREEFVAEYHAVPRKQEGVKVPSSEFDITGAGTWVLSSALTPRIKFSK